MELRTLFVAIISISLVACGGGSSTDTTLSGEFTSSGAVEGITYTTATQSGVTDTLGTFDYVDGETITFSLGDTIIGETVPAKAAMTPLDLVPGAVLYTTYNKVYHLIEDLSSNASARIALNKLSNILTFLQTLDEDKNPSNGIYINPGMAALFIETQINFAISLFNFEQDNSDNAAFNTRVHQAVTQGILNTAVIPSVGVALDQFYSKQSISHNFAVLSEHSYDSDNDGSPNETHTYTYDTNGNKLTYSYVDVDDTGDNYITTYTYDANGNLLTETKDSNSTNDPGINESKTHTYDANGHKLSKIYVDADDTDENYITTYTYDANGHQLTYTKDSDSTDNPGVNESSSSTYDANGNQLTYSYVNVDDTSYNDISTYTYDANGNQLTYTYDTNSTNDPGVNETSTTTYDANGNRLTIIYVHLDSIDNNYITTYTYDANGNQLTYTKDSDSTNNPGINKSRTTTYDTNGNQLTYSYVNVDKASNDSISTFTYDANGYLLTDTYDTNSTNDPGINNTSTYTYDVNGNRLTYSSVNVDADYNSTSTYTYDANGNQLTDTYDSNSTNDPGVNSTRDYTWVSSTWVGVLDYIY